MIKLRDIFIILACLFLVLFIAKKGFAKQDDPAAVSVAEFMADTPRITNLKEAKKQKGDDTLIAEAKAAKNFNELQAVVIKLVTRETGQV